VIYGDASQIVVLEAGGVHNARAVLITVPAFADVRNIVSAARHAKPDVPIIARADGIEAVRALYAVGIQEVTSPEFEAAIEMTRQALMYFNVPAHDVLRVASAIRHERYDMNSASGASGLAIMAQIGEIARQLEFTWVGVVPDSAFDGRTLDALRIRSTIGASIVAIIRDNALVANPDGQARLQAGDLVALLGTREQIDRFRQAMAAAVPA
jgi:monovalent cation:H+ antiporter-2, CPA2 family